MRRASVAAAGFALVEGAEADPGGLIHVASLPDQFGRTLLACVEPLDLTPRGMELAAVALRVIRETFTATPGTAAEGLLAAFAAANAAIIAENRPLSTGRWERRICVGATGVAINGRDIVVAQAAPTQAILVQDEQVYPFPDIASWRGDFTPDSAALEAGPLGFAEDASPRLYYSEAAPGDLIALCSTSVGRVLGRDEEAVVDLFGGVLLTADLEGSIDRLERLLASHEVIDAFALVASVTRLPQPTRRRPALPRRRVGRADQEEPDKRRSGTRTEAMERQPAAPAAPRFSLPVDGDDNRPPAFEGMRDALIGAVEALSSVRRQRRKPAPHFDSRQRAIAAPGALSVSRYREASGLPAEWRANLPRGPVVHVPARLLAVSLVLFLTIGGTGFAWDHQRDREAHAAESLAAADVALRNALEIPGSASTLVAEADAALDSARASGANGEPLTRREQELARVRDQVWNVQRLDDVQRIGALPRELGGQARLALSGSTLYLVAGNLYEFDPAGPRLITLLAQGDAVEGGVAGDLRDVSVDGGHVVASDGAATYTRDAAGRWQRRELAVADVGGLHAGLPLISWGDAAYGMSRDGDIIRFEETAGGPLADIWTEADEMPDLELAQDMAIDGRIHVLLQDGRTLTFSRGALAGTVSPFVVPTLTKAAFLAQAPFATDFYIIDPTTRVGENVGRIVRADAAGNARQYLTPLDAAGDGDAGSAAAALAKAEDMTIDELTGTIYWVSGDEIWQAHLPG